MDSSSGCATTNRTLVFPPSANSERQVSGSNVKTMWFRSTRTKQFHFTFLISSPTIENLRNRTYTEKRPHHKVAKSWNRDHDIL